MKKFIAFLLLAVGLHAAPPTVIDNLSITTSVKLPAGLTGLLKANGGSNATVAVGGTDYVVSIAEGSGISITGSGGVLTIAATGGSAVWGDITGTLSNQTDLNTALGLKAPLASPALTGAPTAPTATVGTNTTQIATTAFVLANQSGGATWGSITGTLSAQTDLATALAAKVPTTTTVNGHALSSNVTVTPTDLSLVIGTNVQAYAANLTGWAAISPFNQYTLTTATTSVLGGVKVDGTSITINGSGVISATSSGGGTITQIIFSTGLTGGTITTNGTVAIDTTVVATLTGTQTLTNKTISGGSNTLSSIANSSLTNSSISIAGTSTSLGGSITLDTITGLSTTGILKRTGSNTLAIATAGTDYLTANQSITLSGDVTGSGATSIAATVVKINGTSLASLATGILKNTTSTGVPSIAVAGTDYLAVAGGTTVTTLGTITTGTWTGTTIAAANGGTGVTSFGGTNAILYTSSTSTLAAVTTADNGVLITNGSGVPSWLAAGTNTYVLTMVSGAPAWAAAGGGGGSFPITPDTYIQGLINLNLAMTSNTAADSLELYGTGTASSANQIYSGSIHFEGIGWKTTSVAGPQNVDVYQYVAPIQGTTNPSIEMLYTGSVNGGTAFPFLLIQATGLNGNVTLSSGTTGNNFTIANCPIIITANSGNNLSLGGGGTAGVVSISSTTVTANSGILSKGTGGVGYVTGAGGTVTQATSRSTGVTLNKIAGVITGNGSSLAGLATVTFTVTDSTVAAVDTVVLSETSASAGAAATLYKVTGVAAGSFTITEINTTASTADTGIPVWNFTVIKGASS